jgi:hypothetical protein
MAAFWRARLHLVVERPAVEKIIERYEAIAETCRMRPAQLAQAAEGDGNVRK